jgi:hypothetical protein
LATRSVPMLLHGSSELDEKMFMIFYEHAPTSR